MKIICKLLKIKMQGEVEQEAGPPQEWQYQDASPVCTFPDFQTNIDPLGTKDARKTIKSWIKL